MEKEKEVISIHELSDKRMTEIEKLNLDLNFAKEESKFYDHEYNEIKQRYLQLQHELEEASDSFNKQIHSLSEKNENLISENSSLNKQISGLKDEVLRLKNEKYETINKENSSKKESAASIILLSNEIKRLTNKNELLSKEIEIARMHTKLLKGKIDSKLSLPSNTESNHLNKKIYDEEAKIHKLTSPDKNLYQNNDNLIQSQISLNSYHCKSLVINKIDLDAAAFVQPQVRKNTYQRKKLSKPNGLGKGKLGFLLDDLETSKLEDLFDDETNKNYQAKLNDTGLDISVVNKCPSQAINCMKSDEESVCNYHIKHVCTEELVNLHPASSYKPLKSSINKFNEQIVTATNASTNFNQSELRKYWSSQIRICCELNLEITSSTYSDCMFFSRLFDLHKLNYSNPDHFILINRSRLYNKAKERRIPFFKFGEFILSELEQTLETLNIKKKVPTNKEAVNSNCVNSSSNLSFRVSNSGSRNLSTTSVCTSMNQKTNKEKPGKALAYFSSRFV